MLTSSLWRLLSGRLHISEGHFRKENLFTHFCHVNMRLKEHPGQQNPGRSRSSGRKNLDSPLKGLMPLFILCTMASFTSLLLTHWIPRFWKLCRHQHNNNNNKNKSVRNRYRRSKINKNTPEWTGDGVRILFVSKVKGRWRNLFSPVQSGWKVTWRQARYSFTTFGFKNLKQLPPALDLVVSLLLKSRRDS